ncbi:hypothetical protein [Rhizobium multihospitium]|uniref:Uncharacterized protein n=1 Tax=Rhizobium multihospitium TaxID=410764 RepID=A0A1C3X427_9HYPH|nr:hypothetical protein [Rhizobium multihospitium]SCB46989.1 hypothetical protein GA0061103_0056 [Rhizobium multihospitium]
MKTQQRRFVVEFKSKGRRSVATSGSIWGTTDLKALARQAASVAPQLFDDAGATIDIATATPTPVLAPVPVVPTATGVENIGSASVGLQSVEPIAIAPTPVEEPRPFTAGNAATRSESSRAVRHVEHKLRSLQKPVTTAFKNPVTAYEPLTDELALLELENRRLKSLLIERLRHENRQLRTMLERFGGIH